MLCVILAGKGSLLISQNLVPNYSFETLWYCPLGFGGFGPTPAPPWVAPTTGTADIFNECATSADVSVPVNYFGYQEPITGVGYGGFYCKLINVEYREYLQAPLTQPLLAGVWYYVSFYVSPSEFFGCSVMNIGAYFSAIAPTNFFYNALDLEPQVESSQGFLVGFDNWILIEGCFQATGGEQYITLGNFNNDADTPLGPTCVSDPTSYYYLEDVSVVQTSAPEDIAFELGGPETACFSYEIDPGISDVNYDWEDGSQNPTLIVTESGTYSLTVTDVCNFGIDSIEIIIGGNSPPVDLGPDTTICSGETFYISLDPDLSTYEWNDGTIGSNYTITEAGTYAVTLDDGCASSTDEITVFVMDPPPAFNLGDDAILCVGEEIEFSFDPSLGDFIWQDGSTNSTFTATTGGQYAVTISNMCGTESDQITLTSLLPPSVEIGPASQTICDGDILEINISPVTGDLLWQDGNTSSTYSIYSAGNYGVTVSNECGEDVDMVDVFVNYPPTVDLGPDTIVCEGESIILTATSSDSDFLWQDNSTDEEYLVESPGIYSVSVTNDCGTGTDEILVEYFPDILPPDLGPDISICPGDQVVLYASTPDVGYLWQDDSTADSLLVSTSGTYILQVFSNCQFASDTVEVFVNNNPPSVNLPDQFTLCQGDTVILDAGISGVNYLWNDNTQNQQLVIYAPGTYILTVSNACGTDVDSTFIDDGGPAPFVNLGNDISLCTGDLATVTPTFSNVNNWLWQDNSNLPFLTVNGPGLVSVAASNSCGTAYDTLLVTSLPDPLPFDLGPDTSLCAGESVTLAVDTTEVNILWSNGASTPSITISNPGIFYATTTNSCGQTSDTMIISALSGIPNLDLGPDQLLCSGEIIILNPGIPDVQYLWSDGSTSNSFTSTQPETIILTIFNECGTASDTLEVIATTQGPQLDLGPDLKACSGDTVTISPAISGVNYLWQDGSTNAEIMTTQSGTFILNVTNNCGADSDTIFVEISGVPPTIELGKDTTLCEGTTLSLTSNADAETSIEWQDGSSNPNFFVDIAGTYTLAAYNECGEANDSITITYLNLPDPFTLGPDTALCINLSITLQAPLTPYPFQWQDGSVAPSLLVTMEGTYSLSTSNSCGTQSDSIIVSFINAPVPFTLGPDTTLCPNQIVTLTAPGATDQFMWQDGTTLPFFMVEEPGSYSLEVSNECGSVSDTLDVNFDTRMITLNLDPSVPLCKEDTITLDATQAFTATYLWSTGENAPSIQIMTPGIYNVEVTIPCMTSIQDVSVIPGENCQPVEIEVEITVPNVFSPNSDGINDAFAASFSSDLEITVMEGSIFDRWGNLVYSSQAIPFIWDGYFDGEILMPGVYVYVIRCTYVEGTREQQRVFAGDVTIVR